MITSESQEISTAEFKARLGSLPSGQRHEILVFLRALEEEAEKQDGRNQHATTPNNKVAEPASGLPRTSIQEAKAYLYRNCDRLLQRLAQ